jgi:hypothetical protein
MVSGNLIEAGISVLYNPENPKEHPHGPGEDKINDTSGDKFIKSFKDEHVQADRNQIRAGGEIFQSLNLFQS